MINNILLILIIILIVFGYSYIFILYISNKDKSIKTTSYEISLELLNDDTSIRLVEKKSSYFSTYSIRRNMIKLSSKTYYGEDVFSCFVGSFLSGYEIVNNKYISILGKIFKNLRIISFAPIILLIINILTTNQTDAKIAIIITLLIGIYQYILYDIHKEILDVTSTIDKKIRLVFNKMLTIDKMFFITSLIAILRFVIIILNI